ncbi:uncharacterized protein LOC125036973 [Penaeus chinensis]|uniref:uncharacterized protein LOC125036973 n=1 Tax=Penaeus chinensis TaxID=139456 RepID=UPI001FB5D3D8|nr:uncharacterized protein LOC125036973 [Penaeus chinensis]
MPLLYIGRCIFADIHALYAYALYELYKCVHTCTSKLQPTFASAQSLLNTHILYFQAISVYKMKFLATAVILCLAVLYSQALPAEMPSSPLLLSRVARSPQFPPRDCVPCTCKTTITEIIIIEHEVRPAATRFGGGPPCCPCPPPPF